MQSTSGQTDVKELSKECILCEKLIYKNQAWGRIRNVLVISGDVIEVRAHSNNVYMQIEVTVW